MPDIYHLVFIQSTPEKIYKAITTEEGMLHGGQRRIMQNQKQEVLTRSISDRVIIEK